jgi:hypothetical protein
LEILLLAGLAATLPAGPSHAAEPTTQPASAEATTAPAVDPAALAILRRLEGAGKQYRNLHAEVNYQVDDRLTGDRETRTGWVAFAHGDPADNQPARFRVHFETLKLGRGPTTRDPIDYALDGEWFTIAKHRARQMIRSQMPRDRDPLDIGQGYFPVPFGQRAGRVVQVFDVSTRSPRNSDPNDTDYLRLIPRPRHRRRLETALVELWVDRETNLPVLLRRIDDQKKRTTVRFDKIDTGRQFDRDMFYLPRRPGWSYHVETWDPPARRSRPTGRGR